MTADKRTPHTDALDTLGFIIGVEEKRDAIHLAVEPVTAGHMLRGGDHVDLRGGLAVKVMPGSGLGIVDPFLDGPVEKGQRFWLVVYPRQITSLRHVWEHPAFPPAVEAAPVLGDKEASEKWLREFISSSDCPDYETVIAKALNNSDAWDSSYLHFDGEDAHGEIPPEFWDHLEIVTGKSVPSSDRAEYFSCSC